MADVIVSPEDAHALMMPFLKENTVKQKHRIASINWQLKVIQAMVATAVASVVLRPVSVPAIALAMMEGSVK